MLFKMNKYGQVIGGKSPHTFSIVIHLTRAVSRCFSGHFWTRSALRTDFNPSKNRTKQTVKQLVVRKCSHGLYSLANDHTTTSLCDLTHSFSGDSHLPWSNEQHAIEQVWVICVIEGFTESLVWILIVGSKGNKGYIINKKFSISIMNSPATNIYFYQNGLVTYTGFQMT